MTNHIAREKPANTPIKILWVNPVNLPDYDEAIAEQIARVKLPNAEVHIVSLDLPGPVKLTNLEWRAFESQIWFPVTQIAHYAGANGFDGYAIGCFYDTAMEEAREVSGDCVVGAPCEASLKIVTTLCNRFSVVIGVEKWKLQMEERIRFYGYHDRLASFRVLGMHVDEFQENPEKTEAAIRQAVRDAIEIDKAEAVILGCTIEYGFYAQLQEEFGVPIVDALFAAYKSTEAAALNKAQFGWKPSRLYSMEPPGAERLVASGVFAGAPPIGNTVIVPRN